MTAKKGVQYPNPLRKNSLTCHIVQPISSIVYHMMTCQRPNRVFNLAIWWTGHSGAMGGVKGMRGALHC